MVAESGFGEPVQFAIAGVRFHLTVPGLGVERGEPRAQSCQLFGSELLNLSFDLLNPAHIYS